MWWFQYYIYSLYSKYSYARTHTTTRTRTPAPTPTHYTCKMCFDLSYKSNMLRNHNYLSGVYCHHQQLSLVDFSHSNKRLKRKVRSEPERTVPLPNLQLSVWNFENNITQHDHNQALFIFSYWVFGSETYNNKNIFRNLAFGTSNKITKEHTLGRHDV